MIASPSSWQGDPYLCFRYDAATSVVHLTGIRLSAFKSFRGAELPLGGTTVLTGRNSSGKSNALDGLELLARLSIGEHLREALDGRRKGPVRGGSEGCAPHGSDHFRLGCRAEYEDSSIRYDVGVEVRPTLRIRSESLQGPGVTMGGRKKRRCSSKPARRIETSRACGQRCTPASGAGTARCPFVTTGPF